MVDGNQEDVQKLQNENAKLINEVCLCILGSYAH